MREHGRQCQVSEKMQAGGASPWWCLDCSCPGHSVEGASGRREGLQFRSLLSLGLPSAPFWMQSPEIAGTPEQKQSGNWEATPESDARPSGLGVPQ